MTVPVLSIAIVNHNSGHRLRQCLDAVGKHPPAYPYEVIVVDNASRDGSADFLRHDPPPQARLVASPRNLLWTGGINLAVAQAQGRYVLLLNPDMVALPGALSAMVARLDADPTLGAVGGHSLTRDGRFERYVGQFPTPWQVLLGNYAGERAKRWGWLPAHDLPDSALAAPTEVPQPAGGCLAVRRGFLARPLDARFGLFWSDVELARRVWDARHRIMMFPEVRFVHDHDPAPRRIADERSLLLVLDYLVGCVTYFRLHEGRWAAAQAKAFLGGAAAASLAFKHVPLALLGREPWRMVRARAGVLRDFLRGRNRLLDGSA